MLGGSQSEKRQTNRYEGQDLFRVPEKLSTAPIAVESMVEVRGFEPLTSGLQSPRSAKLSYTPIKAKVGCGGGILTRDLWVMSPTSYRTAPPRVKT